MKQHLSGHTVSPIAIALQIFVWSLHLGRGWMLPASRCSSSSLSESNCITQRAPSSFHPNPSLAFRVGTKKFCLVYLLFCYSVYGNLWLSIWNSGPISAIMQRPYFHISLFWCVNPSPKCLRIPWQVVKGIFTTWLNCWLPTSLLASVTPRVPSLH